MKRRDWIFHSEFLVIIILISAVMHIEYNREIPVNVEIDTTSLNDTNLELAYKLDQLNSLHGLYRLSLEELKSLSIRGGLDRLSSEEAIVGRVFYIGGNPIYYYVSLEEYLEAEYNVMTNSVYEIDESYIRPLTADIKFLADQFVQQYPDKTDRAIAILSLIQNIGYNQNDMELVNHPTVTLMRGGVCIDLVIACGAVLKAADINCAILIFEKQYHAAIGISDIDFERFQNEVAEKGIIEYEGREYLICETTSLRHPAGENLESSLGPLNAETVVLIIPYEFP
jgi:hypothetical protein